MSKEEPCNFCIVLLETHCQEGGQSEACQLLDKYLGGEIGGDEALERFYAIIPDEQLARLDPVVRQRLNQSIDPGQAAAQRWLEGYRHGKNS